MADENPTAPELIGDEQAAEETPGWCIIQIGRGVDE
jgi:hypothetical protein